MGGPASIHKPCWAAILWFSLGPTILKSISVIQNSPRKAKVRRIGPKLYEHVFADEPKNTLFNPANCARPNNLIAY
jgi:hypothetical protein